MAPHTLITGCELYDGSTNAPEKRDVRIAGGIIQEVGALTPERNELVISARGLSLMPGIIQLASDLDTIGGVANVPLERAYASSGITTAVIGLGGSSLAPYDRAQDASAHYPHAAGGWKHMHTMLADLSAREHAINIATLVGSDTLMRARKPEYALREAIHEGAWGCSFGVGDPFRVGSPELSLASAAAGMGKSVFFRPSIGNDFSRELEHALHFSRRYHTPIVADDVMLPKHATPSLLSAFSTALSQSGTSLYALVRHTAEYFFPLPHFSPAHNALVRRMQTDSITPTDMQEIDVAFRDFLEQTGSSTISATKKHSSFRGKLLRDIANDWDMSESSALALLTYRHDGELSITPTLHHSAQRFVRGLSSALPRHSFVPLSYIWKSTPSDNADELFASLIDAATPTERAGMIAKLTSIPANILGLKDRGRIAKGQAADLVLFRSSRPQRASHETAISRVFINGNCLYEEGKARPTTSGRILVAA